jgi:hypothetical protein
MTAMHLDQDAQDAIPVGMYTETLARLYFRQGYAGEALRIYRHLAAERPDDPHLQEQIRVLTEQVASLSEPSTHRPVATDTGDPGTTAHAAWPGGMSRLAPVITELERWLSHLQRRHPPQ